MSRPATGNKSFPVNLRISPEIRQRAMELAKRDDRSFNSWVSLLIKKAVEQEGIANGEGKAQEKPAPVVPNHFAGWDT